ncbi:major facilitator superfamily transporter [Hortaea werneckii]|nr:major facilitator superfamily transporter [Hortaea werneckii]
MGPDHHFDAPIGDESEWSAKIAAWSPEERRQQEKKLVRKIDVRLLPILFIMYILNYVDRNALPQARVQGLEDDIGLQGVQYNVVLSLTFIGYILWQVPSNMLLSKVGRPRYYIAGWMIAWGLVSGCSGAVQNFAGMAACRFFLGITEAPFFVGVAFLFSGWYTRKELGLRLGFFFCAAMLSGAFGGLYAAGIAAAFENHRIASWRWLFITEGAATVVFGAVTAFLIPDWPATTKWLKDDERALGVVRLIEDAGEEEEDIDTKAAAKMAVKDYRVWLCVLGQFCLQAVASLTNFLPTLVKNFGFDTINTLLLTAPPYIFTVLVCIANTWYSDRTSKRSLHITFPVLAAMVGIIITIATTNIAARYFALFIMLAGTYGSFQISNAWMGNISARPQKKRAIGLAMNNAIGNLAQVWTPYLYPESDGPRYTMAWSVNLALCVVIVVSTTALSFSLKRENRKLNNIETDVELSQHEDLGKDPPLDITCIEHHSEHAVAGRRLGGRRIGATARYDT